jgi:outer membrane receptor for ferrienterochelin and colicin
MRLVWLSSPMISFVTSECNIIAVCSLVLLTFIRPLSADESSREPSFQFLNLAQLKKATVESPGKFEQVTADSPSVINVISRDEIERFGANSLLEILDRATSISMTGSFFFPQNVTSIRGDYESHADNHVLLLLNGRPMRESFTGGDNFSIYTAFPITIIKQIEIIRGPGSVLYGSNAFTGVINIVTQNAEETRNELIASLGSFSTRAIKGSASYSNEDFSVIAGMHIFKENGWDFAAVDNNSEWGKFETKEDNQALVLTSQFKNFSLNSLLTHSVQDFWGSTSTWSGIVAQQDRDVGSKRVLIDLGYQYSFSDQRYINTNFSYTKHEFSHYNYDSSSKNLFVESTHHWKLSEDLRWLVGVTWWHQDVSSQERLSPAPVPSFEQNWKSVYSEINLAISPNFSWVIGAQINKVPDVSANTVFRLGTVYQFSHASGIKINHGQSFRAAYGVETNFDLVICCRNDGSNVGGLRGNPELDPEMISTTDLQYYYQTNKHQFNATAFYSDQQDLIERQRAADNVLDFINKGSLVIKGIEIEYKVAVTGSAQITSSFTYQTNKTNKTAASPAVSNFTLQPSRMLKIGYSHSWSNAVTLGLFNSWFDSAYDNVMLNPSRLDVNPKASAYNILTANVSIPLTRWKLKDKKNPSIELYAYNLLDESIYQAETAGKTINTNPLRSGRSVYLSLIVPL